MSSSSALSLEPKPTPMRLMETRKKFIETNLDSTTSSFSMSSLSSMTVVTKTSTSPVSIYPIPTPTKAAATTPTTRVSRNYDDSLTVVRTPPVSINHILIPHKDTDTTNTSTETDERKPPFASFPTQTNNKPPSEVIITPKLTTATFTATAAPLAQQESSSISSSKSGEVTAEEKRKSLSIFEKNHASSYGAVAKNKRGGIGVCFGTMILISDCLLCHGEPSY